MELDETVCKRQPYNSCDMVSMVDYFAALDVPGALLLLRHFIPSLCTWSWNCCATAYCIQEPYGLI